MSAKCINLLLYPWVVYQMINKRKNNKKLILKVNKWISLLFQETHYPEMFFFLRYLAFKLILSYLNSKIDNIISLKVFKSHINAILIYDKLLDDTTIVLHWIFRYRRSLVED